jgi:hypothetical protein
MSVTIHCPHCGATGNAPDHILGQSVRCSKCKKQFVAGGDEEEQEETPEEEPADDFGDMDDDAPPRKAKARSGGGGGGDGGGGGFGDVLMFRKMIGPVLIVIAFWLGVATVVIFGLMTMLSGFMSGSAMFILLGLFGGLISIVIGLFFVRLMCEMMLVQFRIYEVLKELKKPG